MLRRRIKLDPSMIWTQSPTRYVDFSAIRSSKHGDSLQVWTDEISSWYQAEKKKEVIEEDFL